MSLWLSSIIMAIAGILISKNLLNHKGKLKILTCLITILLISLPTILFYELNYNGFVTIGTFLMLLFSYHYLFKETYTTSLLLAIFTMLLTAFADLLWSSIGKIFVDITAAREIWYVMLVSNIGISIIAVLFSKIKKIQKLFQGLAKKLAKKIYVSTILFLLLFLIVMIILHINMLEIFKTNEAYIISSITLAIVFCLYCIYITEKINYDKLSSEYDSLFTCIQTFENWIDKEQLGIHEMKNNLSILRGMTKNKKIHEQIDAILNESIVIEKDWVEQLKNIPSGGIKGLLYYKMAIAKDKKVHFYVEVSPKVNKLLKGLNEKEIRELNILLGIYLDNAIESAEGTKKPQVMLEIYACKQNITFVLSNTWKEKPKMEKMNKKGYSTKGIARGNGLYFTSKILNKNEKFKSIQKIVNEFYVQKLILYSPKKEHHV